jgi:DNA-binding IclR family transcriptional regulator
VADALRRLFAADNQGLRLADLRSRTGFGNMQLHRALQLLLAEGEIRRRGKDRKTEYLRTPTRPATHHRARPGGRDRKSGR